jgi:cytochrome c-type biogenesis protein CcmH
MNPTRVAVRLALAVAVALAIVGPLGSTATAAITRQRTTLYAVETQVMCVTCEIPLVEAQSAQADRERAYIQGLIEQGKTLAQIKALLVKAYGTEVLALPPATGFNAAVYIVPIAVVVALLVLVAVLLPRWRRRRTRQEPSVAPVGAPISAADAARLDADLARLD